MPSIAGLLCSIPLSEMLSRNAQTLGGDHGARFEFECYDVGLLYLAGPHPRSRVRAAAPGALHPFIPRNQR